MLNRARAFLGGKPQHVTYETNLRINVNWEDAIMVKGDSSPFANLPPIAELVADDPWIKFDDVRLDCSPAEYAAHDSYPLPSTAEREGYHGERHYDYWLSGLKDYLSITQPRDREGVHLAPGDPVLDLGCASGRVLRHFVCQQPGLELWGADINARHVEWVRRYLGSEIKVFQNTSLPHLPLQDNYFSLVYAFSVFTHIDSLELAWLAELRRVLRPGGIAYLTVQTEHTWRANGPNRAVYHELMKGKESQHLEDERVTPDMFEHPMPGERVAFCWKAASVSDCIIFHSEDYLRNTWGRFFEVIDIVREGSDYQDVVILRKR
jgi:ubiquinone/menaquinone biosynthesis C-methylase UbiE